MDLEANIELLAGQEICRMSDHGGTQQKVGER
jgi:hypothetical protein